VIRNGARLVGVLPLYVGQKGLPLVGSRRLGFISTGVAEYEETSSDYLDLLHAPGEAERCLQAVRTALKSPAALCWDELDLSELSSESLLAFLANSNGGPFGRIVTQGTGYRSDLTGGFEAYLRRLSHGARAAGRRLLREVQRSGMVFKVATDAEQADLFFTEMVELHHRRWQAAGRSGSFAPRHAEFHRTLARTLVPTGGVFLSRLSLDGQPFAVAYGHRVRHTYHCYQRGVNLQTKLVCSPGTAVLLLLMAHLVERGVTCYDHLMGANSFKQRYATEQHTFVRLCATRPTFRSFASFLTDYVRQGSRKALSFVRRCAKPTKS
jgi:hypothetical protein